MARLDTLDWIIVAAILAISLSIGVLVSRRAGASSRSFFLSGRSMPWWLLGTSMVATTFSTDTPNLVTNFVRTNGVAGNWIEISMSFIVLPPNLGAWSIIGIKRFT